MAKNGSKIRHMVTLIKTFCMSDQMEGVGIKTLCNSNSSIIFPAENQEIV